MPAESIPAPETTTVTLVIALTPDGQVSLTGPIHNKLLCYGLLEAAKDALRSYTGPAPRIVRAATLPGSNGRVPGLS